MPWQPGESGNPEGSQKRRKFYETLDRAIVQEDGRRLRRCVESLLDKAAAGESWAVQMVADRLDGRPPQAVQVGGDPDGVPLKTEINVNFTGAK